MNIELQLKNTENPKKNSNKNEEENKDEKEETKEEQNEKEDDHKEKDDIEAKIKRKNIIIKSLIYFNRDITADGIENFKKRTPDYNKSKYEEDNKLEKNIYIKIEDRIREILNKSKSDKLSLLREFENNYLLRITNFEKKSENYKYLCIKGIIIGLINIINDWAGKEYLKCTDEKNNIILVNSTRNYRNNKNEQKNIVYNQKYFKIANTTKEKVINYHY